MKQMIALVLSALLGFGLGNPPPPQTNQVCMSLEGLNVDGFNPQEYENPTLSLSVLPTLTNHEDFSADSPLTGELLRSIPSIALKTLENNGYLNLKDVDSICWPVFSFHFDLLYIRLVVNDQSQTLYMGHVDLHVPDRADIDASYQVKIVKSPGEFALQAAFTLHYQIQIPINDSGLGGSSSDSESNDESNSESNGESSSESNDESSSESNGESSSDSDDSSEEIEASAPFVKEHTGYRSFMWIYLVCFILASICFFGFAWCMCKSAFCSKYSQPHKRHYVQVQDV